MKIRKIFFLIALLGVIGLCGCNNSDNETEALKKQMEELQKQNEELSNKLDEMAQKTEVKVTEVPEVTMTPAPTSTPTPTPEPTSTPVPTEEPKTNKWEHDVKYDFSELACKNLDAIDLSDSEEGTIVLKFDKKEQEFIFSLPEAINLEYCYGIIVTFLNKDDIVSVNLYNENGDKMEVLDEIIFNGYEVFGIVEPDQYMIVPVPYDYVTKIGIESAEEKDIPFYNIVFNLLEEY